MVLNIEAFTHQGVLRSINQDSILVNDKVLNQGTFSQTIESPACFFVADGVGGLPHGEMAAKLVLESLNDTLTLNDNPEIENIAGICHAINHQLIMFGEENPKYAGMATTLAGIIFNQKKYLVINAGDSQVMLLRNQRLQKLTLDQVVNTEISNSPITSYFGGMVSSLDISISSGTDEVMANDIFMVSSDGIFKALTPAQIEKILSNSKSLKEKSEFIFYKAMQNGAPDNISCIFIEVQKTGFSG